MKVNFGFPHVRGVLLGEVAPGEFIHFLDSGVKTQSVTDVISTPGENIFMVFDRKKLADGHVDLVSIDGEIMIRRQNTRLVRVLKRLIPHVVGSPGISEVLISSVKLGEVVLFHGVSIPLFNKLKKEDKYKNLYLVAKGNPSPAGKVVLVSLSGDEVLIDDDLLVRVYENSTIMLDLK